MTDHARAIALGMLALGVLVVGCDDVRSNDGKQIPKTPPPPQAGRLSLQISVVVDGTPRAPITAERLDAIPADFVEGEHRAWRISSLLGKGGPDAGTITATGAHGVTIDMTWSAQPDQPTPALFVTRRGDVIAAVVDPRDPFPDFHGRGRRLGRPGDPLPRVADVSKIEVRAATARD